MPRSAGHQGRPDYPALLDQRWTDHHVPVVRQGFTVRVEVRHAPTQGAYNQVTATRPMIAGALVYSGMGRIVSIGDDSTVEIGGQQVTTRQYRIEIDYTTGLVKNGMIVEVTEVSEPVAQLLGREFVVISPALASMRWATAFIAELNEG